MSISAIILAGGRAVRMGGQDKGLLPCNQKPLIAHVIERLKPQVDEILISANRQLESYGALGYAVLQDALADFAGPLAGIQSGLKHAHHDYVLTAPCDSPALPQDLAQRLQAALIANDADIAIATSDGHTHPVFCLCKKSVLATLNRYLEQGGRKVSEWQKSLKHVYVDFSDCGDTFTNLNTLQELASFESQPQNALARGATGRKLPVIGICASGSNAGKTTLIKKLIAEFGKRGIRVSVIKHAHHQFDIDHPGKDSYEIREAGAVQTLVASGNRWALMTEMQRTPQPPDEANLTELIQLIDPDYADLILVEGFKNAGIAKIEIHRPGLHMPLVSETDNDFIAIASDNTAETKSRLPVLNLNDIKQLADFIAEKIKN